MGLVSATIRRIKAQAVEAPAFAFRVFGGVLNPYIMSLEELVKLKAGLNSYEMPQFPHSEPVMLVLLDRQGLQRTSRRVSAPDGQPLGEIVGNLDGHVHSTLKVTRSALPMPLRSVSQGG